MRNRESGQAAECDRDSFRCNDSDRERRREGEEEERSSGEGEELCPRLEEQSSSDNHSQQIHPSPYTTSFGVCA